MNEQEYYQTLGVPFKNGFPIDPTWQHIAVNLSGGADSALMMIHVIELSTAQISIINYQRCWRTRPWQVTVYERVRDWLQTRYPGRIANEYRHWIDPQLEQSRLGTVNGRGVEGMIMQGYNHYIVETQGIDALYNALTQVSTDIATTQNIRETASISARVAPDISRLGYRDKQGAVHLKPWTMRDKRWVYSEYRRRDLLELWQLTRSCEGEVPGLTWAEWEGTVPEPCGQCFWCQERAWAEQ